jgi:23S rRNA pseudouridine1911/1915/1917 synthase
VSGPSILYEDDDILAVNKPAGLLTHGDGRSSAPTLTDWLVRERPSLASVGEPMQLADGRTLARPGIVHRLDAETSGVIVVAKTPAAHAYLKRLFAAREVEKTYDAFLVGVPRERSGEIALEIGRSRSDFRRFAAGPRARGKTREALTEYRVRETGGGFSLVEVRPKTGRTHQIRVHFASIGHPVVCDRRYAPKRPSALGLTRLALHARSLSLEAPSGARLLIEAPPPEDFERALALLRAAKK